MCTIHFHLRPSSLGREFEGSLFIRVIHARKALSVTTPYRLFPSEWNERHHCIIYRPGVAISAEGESCPSRHNNASRFLHLSHIEKMMIIERELLSSIIDSLNEQGPFTVTEVVRLYRLRKSGVPMTPFVDKLATHLENRGQYRTARAYRTVARGLAAFADKESFSLTDIRPALLKDFQADMLSKGKTLNTVSFYMRNLRAIYNRAVHDSLIDPPGRNPFDDVYTGVEQTRKRALTQEEMSLLSGNLFDLMKRNSPLSTPDMEPQSDSRALRTPQSLQNEERPHNLLTAQRLFLFSFHARGMSFVDVAFLKKSDIQGNLLTYRRRKTGQLLEITLTPEMRHIIDNFREETKDSPYLFPIIQRPGVDEYRQYENGLKRQNRQLKRLATLLQWKVESGKLKVKLDNQNKESFLASSRKQNNFQLWLRPIFDSTFNFQLSTLAQADLRFNFQLT